MFRVKPIALLTLFSMLLPIAGTADAGNAYVVRQYYSSWHKHPKSNYHYRSYYYKPTATYSGYQHHYVMHFPKRPKHYYYYNPYKKVYWGRCSVDTQGKPEYSLLAEKDRKGDIEAIPESAFPKPAPLPAIPGATDNETLDLPPDDLPPDNNVPAIAVP